MQVNDAKDKWLGVMLMCRVITHSWFKTTVVV